MKTVSFALGIVCALAPQAVLAASSDWHDLQGAALRLVTDDKPNENGILRGALEIALKPGWKTYWRDPGPAGVAPTISVAVNGTPVNLEIDFPQPLRVDDGYSIWAGYKAPVTLAVNIQIPPETARPEQLDAHVFLGLCETICIPAQAEFSLQLPSDISNAENQRVIDTAFAQLPQRASKDTLLVRQETPDAIVFEAAPFADNTIQDLFVAGTDDLVLGTPEMIVSSTNQTVFNVPVVYRAKNAANQVLAYTLVTDNQTLSGKIALP